MSKNCRLGPISSVVPLPCGATPGLTPKLAADPQQRKKGELHEYLWKNRIGDLRSRKRGAGAGRSSARRTGGSRGLVRGAEARIRSGGAPAATVDVAAVLTKLAASNKEKLDWQKSIVDLMKLLNLDSSLAARKELADELHYSGDKNDSATMNIWLHKQVMLKLAENGGKVPDELRK